MSPYGDKIKKLYHLRDSLKSAIPWIKACKANRGAVEYNRDLLARCEAEIARLECCEGCKGVGEVYSNNAWMRCPYCSGARKDS